YSHVYPGVDLTVHGDQQQVYFDFHIAAATDLSQVAMRFSGTDQVTEAGDGNLWLNSPAGNIALSKPIAYQEIDGQHTPVSASLYFKDGRVRFIVANYDRNRELFLTPVFNVGASQETAPELRKQAETHDLRPFVLLFPAVGLAVFGIGIANSQR